MRIAVTRRRPAQRAEARRTRVLTVVAIAAAAVLLPGSVLLPASGAAASATVSAPTVGIAARTATDQARPKVASKQSADVTLFADGSGIIAPGQDLAVTAVITNTGSDALAPGTLHLGITDAPFAARTALGAWLDKVGDAPATRQIGAASTGPITPGTSVTISVFVPAASLGLADARTQVYGLSASLAAGGGDIGKGTGSLVWNTGTGFSSSKVAVAVPITAPATADGLISANDLATYTAPNGVLTRVVNGLSGHPNVAIGIDPMIIASIKVLGTAAPVSATAWLEQLSLLPNDSFPLQYGDADVAAQVQSGLDQLLQPISFTYAMNPGDLKTPSTVGETPAPTPTDTPSGTATPTPTSGPVLPTTQQLLSWPYTLSGISWPPDASIRATDLSVLAKNQFTTTILSGSNTNAATLKTTPNAALSVPGGRALVSDAAVSSALRAATGAATENGYNAGMAALSAQLAMIGDENGAHTVILATLGRSGPTSSQRLSQALQSLNTMPWSAPASIQDAIQSVPTTELAVKDTPESDARIASIKGLLTRETGTASPSPSITQFATVLTDPTALTGPARNQLMSLLGVGWLGEQVNWPAAVSASLTASDKIIDSVQIVPPGNVSQLSNEVLIPITVSNKFTLPVNVVLHTTPSNGRLEIDDDTPKTVPAGATAKLLVPVKARVGNGKVQLTMELFSPTGVKIGNTQKATVDVHAEWESLGALIIGILAVLLFGFGIFRSIRRRRRERAVPAVEATPDAPSTSSGTDSETDRHG